MLKNLRWGQLRVLQSLNSALRPTQVLPPMQLLTLCCLPPPQVAEQALQVVHEPQLAATVD